MKLRFLPASELDPQFTWATTDLFPSDGAWEAVIPEIQKLIEQLKACQGTLGRSAQDLLAFFKLEDQFTLKAEPFACYAMYQRDQDTRDPRAQKMNGQMMNLLIQAEEATAFATPEILEIPQEAMDRFYREEPGLEHYRLALTRIRRQKDHTLSPSEEALLASAGKIGQSPSDHLQPAQRRRPVLPRRSGPRGQQATLSPRAPISPWCNPPTVPCGNLLSAILYSCLRPVPATPLPRSPGGPDEAAAVLCRRAKLPLCPARRSGQDRGSGGDLSQPDRCRAGKLPHHAPVYAACARRLLGVEKLHYYDIYTPMVADQDETIPFEEAKEMALEALAPLGEDYLSMLKEGFANRWIDVYENQGKRSGAYSSGVYSCHPFVLLNYTDTLNDVFTLVHEMGHALHSYLSAKNQSVTYADYVIFVAEVASTCNESLLMQHLLANTTQDKKRRACLINHFLEQFRTTLYRQTMFAEFELWCSQQVQQGKPSHRGGPVPEVRRPEPGVLRRGHRARPGDCPGMGTHPPLLYELLCVSVRHWILRGHRPVPAHLEGRPARRAGLPALPFRRLLYRPGLSAEKRGGGHGLSRSRCATL